MTSHHIIRRVLHLSSAATWRGGEQQIALLVKGLQEKGISNYIMTPSGSALGKEMQQHGLSTEYYRKGWSWNPLVAVQLRAFAQKEKIDIIHMHDSHAHNYAIIAAMFGEKKPMVLSRKVDFIPNSLWKYKHKSIRKIICVSKAVKEIVASKTGTGDKCVVISDATDLDDQPTGSIRDFINIPPDSQLVLNIAALADHKDHMTFVRTAHRYLNTYAEDTHFCIVGGDAGTEGEVRNMVKALNIEDKVHLVGFKENARKYLSDADAFLFTSKEEGMGSSLLDAFKYGVPIVATRAGGISEIIRHRENGLLAAIGNEIELAQCLHNVLTDHVLYNQLIIQGKKDVLDYSYNRLADKTLYQYQLIV